MALFAFVHNVQGIASINLSSKKSLKEYNLTTNKHIPDQYKLTSREIRLSLLASLIDSDGYYNPKNISSKITQKKKTLANDILFLVRSLGVHK